MMLPMTNIAMPTTSCHDISGAIQHAGGSAAHFRQHSISDSAPGSNATQLMFADGMQNSSAAGASWSRTPQVPEGGSGHCRKGSQESVDFPGSLASDSFCSTTFAGGHTHLYCMKYLLEHSEYPANNVILWSEASLTNTLLHCHSS